MNFDRKARSKLSTGDIVWFGLAIFVEYSFHT
jgi:hypothetical protein